MMIAYDTVYTRGAETPYDTSPTLRIGVSGGSVLLTLDTKNFSVKYKNGEASVSLDKNLSSADVRELAKTLLEAANKIDNQERWIPVDVIGSNVGTKPAGMSLVQETKLHK